MRRLPRAFAVSSRSAAVAVVTAPQPSASMAQAWSAQRREKRVDGTKDGMRIELLSVKKRMLLL
jgi:hypothetical protein